MKILKSVIIVLSLTLLFLNCKQNTSPEVKTVEVSATSETAKKLDPNATYAKAEFTINGMVCEIGCAKTIEKKLASLEGVKIATVDFNKKLAMVEYDEAKVSTKILENTVAKVGKAYEVSNMKTVDTFSE